MAKKVYQIAIDGPGGAGKSSIAKAIAKKLNLLFINTGAMYRGYAVSLQDTDLDNLSEVQHVLTHNKVSLSGDSVFLNNKDVTKLAYSPKITALASKIGTIDIVRKKCVADQQKIAAGINCIMEGRDTTTVVLPNATLKIFLTASLDVRAKRRWLQNNKKQNLEVIKQELIRRDHQDSHRAIDPLTIANDAIVINSDKLSIGQVISKIIDYFNIKKEVL